MNPSAQRLKLSCEGQPERSEEGRLSARAQRGRAIVSSNFELCRSALRESDILGADYFDRMPPRG